MSEHRNSDNFFGRGGEMELLQNMAAECLGGKGKVAIITGERGIGKTSLLERLRCSIDDNGATFLSAGTVQGSAHPFILFSQALPDWNGLFRDMEHTSFSQIFAVNRSGLLVAHASSGLDEMDADIIAGMLTAVQNFVQDSFDSPGNAGSGLGKLEYGDMKILIEHGENMFLTGVFRGNEHDDMAPLLKRTLEKIEREHGSLIASWSGRVEDVAPISGMVADLARQRFLVKRDLEGVKLSNEKVKIADAVLDILAAKAASKPLILMLEDLQWADESSLFVLEYLSRNIVALPIFILCTARSGENELLDRMTASMAEDGLGAFVALQGLDVEEVSRLMSAICSPNDFQVDFIRDIGQRCSGNPLFVMEMMKQMLEDGQIVRADYGFSLGDGEYSVPESIDDIVQGRLGMLEPGAMRLCECASCMGRVFETGALLAMEFIPYPEAAFESAQARKVLARGDPNSEFVHAIYPEVLYRDISERWRAAYHRNLGLYIERTHPEDRRTVIYDLARHFSRCGDAERAARYCLKAGEMAESVFAIVESIEFYENAVEAMKQLTGVETADTMERLGDLHILVGRTKEAEEAFRQSMIGPTAGDIQARLRRKCSIALMKRGDFEAAMAEAEAGLSTAEGLERMRLEVQRGNIWMMTGQFDHAIEAAERMLTSFSEMGGAQAELGNCHNLLGTCRWYKGDLSKALEHHLQSLAYREAEGHPRRIAISLNNIGLVHHKSGDLAKALEYYERSMVGWEKVGDRDGMTAAYGNIGILRWNMGDLKGALDLFRKAGRISESIGDKQGMVTAYGNISMTLRDMGDQAGSEEFAGKAITMAGALGDRLTEAMTKVNMSETLMMNGQFQEARKALGEARSVFDEAGAKDLIAAERATAAELELEAGDIAAAGIILESLEGGDAIIETVQGRYLTMTGSFEDAWRRLESARATCERDGDLRSVPEIILRMGELRQAEGNHAGAAELYTEALTMFRKMGMSGWAEVCERKLI